MRFSLKRLTRSDLTLFEDQLRIQNAGQQKAINLNRNVFVDVLYPGASRLAGGQPVRFPVDLRIYGPAGETEPHRVTRKIIAAGGTQKNWRLNGETIHSPRGTRRYTELHEGDYAIMGFEGDPVPDSMVLVLFGRDLQVDGDLADAVAALPGMSGAKAMIALDDAEIATIVSAAPAEHPVRLLLGADIHEDLEEAAYGNADAVRRLQSRATRRQTAEELAAARERAQRVGRDGEVLVEAFLRLHLEQGRYTSFVWESDLNAISPFDFTITRPDGTDRRCEVKSTSGPHDRPLHVSQAEIVAAADESAPRTEIWRVSQLTTDGCVLRRSRGFPALARTILVASGAAGAGITPDGWSVSPGLLRWHDPVTVSVDDDPED